jgi:ADP-ribose pyrophosphatase YjhB (NUDIX family)
MNDEVEVWEKVESREIADCRVFKVREDVARSGDKTGKFYVIENPDWVNVVAMTKDFEVVLIEQFRHGTGEVILEIPGGMIDGDESPEAAARRELLEETGYSAREFVFLGKSRPNPAIQNNWIHHFAAVNAEQTDAVKFDEHESVVTKLCPVMLIPNLIKSGEITHSLVLAALQYFSFYMMKV